MSTEFDKTSPPIDPYLNPAYWDGHFMGDGGAQPWPEIGKVGLRDIAVGAIAIVSYTWQGASRLAESRLHTGETFDVSAYDPGTVILTQTERLMLKPEAKDVVPMTAFQDTPVPDHPVGIVDGEQKLVGRGYEYTTRPLLNLVVGKKARRVLTVPDAVLGAAPDLNNNAHNSEVIHSLRRGLTKFTVGDVCNFSDSDPRDQILGRVTEAIVCMNGVRGSRIASLKALLAMKGSLFSPHTNLAAGGTS